MAIQCFLAVPKPDGLQAKWRQQTRFGKVAVVHCVNYAYVFSYREMGELTEMISSFALITS
jgi:hypothetical protein